MKKAIVDHIINLREKIIMNIKMEKMRNIVKILMIKEKQVKMATKKIFITKRVIQIQVVMITIFIKIKN